MNKQTVQTKFVGNKCIVLYIRYSSTGQNEQTVEGQIRVCKEWAEQNGYTVVGIYIDKAKSAWSDSDKRVEFNKMLADAGTGKFQYILVYKFDRFSRNRIDSMMHKQRLKKEFGIRVISATEPVSDDEGGEIYEMFLEWNDEKYSQRLSKRVRDGLDTSVANGTFCGGTINYGYKIRKEPIPNKNDKYIKYVDIDDEQAEVVRIVFDEYVKGTTKEDIAKELNKRGYKFRGQPFKAKHFDLWLKNERYTGVFSFGSRRCDNMFPKIIEPCVFEKAQKRLQKNKYFAGALSTREPYLLTSKCECGHCGTDAVSDGGTSKSGNAIYYYACKKKKKDECDKRREKKERLELLTVVRAVRYIKDPKRAEIIVDDVLRHYDNRVGDSGMKSLDARIASVRKEVESMTTRFLETNVKLLRDSIEQRMIETEVLLNDLIEQKAKLTVEKGFRFTKKDLLEFIADLVKGDPNDKAYQKKIIDNLIYKVFIYDVDGQSGKLRILYNIRAGAEVVDVTFEQSCEYDAEMAEKGVQTQTATLRQKQPRLNTRQIHYFFVKGCACIVFNAKHYVPKKSTSWMTNKRDSKGNFCK